MPSLAQSSSWALTVLAVAACTTASPDQTERPADLLLERATIRAFRGSERRLVATTPSVQFDRQGPNAGHLLTGPIELELPAHGLRVRAARLEGNAVSGQLQGLDVRATTATGTTVTSPLADFDRSDGPAGAIRTDAGVRVMHPTVRLEAAAGHLDLADERATFDGVKSEVGQRAAR